MTTSKRTIEFLDASGHLALEWDPTDPADVARAQVDFANLAAAGYAFFRVVTQEVDGFDPAFGRLEVRRMEAADAEPRLEPVTPAATTVDPADVPIGEAWAKPRRGRPPKAVAPIPTQRPERVVAARPMRGG